MSGGDLVATIMFPTLFAMIFGIVYLRTRENMSMIEKGMNPKQFANRPAPYRNLKWGLLLVGSGIGLFFAYVLHTYVLHVDDDNPVMYFSMIGVGGGLGLIISYMVEKKQTLDNKQE